MLVYWKDDFFYISRINNVIGRVSYDSFETRVFIVLGDGYLPPLVRDYLETNVFAHRPTPGTRRQTTEDETSPSQGGLPRRRRGDIKQNGAEDVGELDVSCVHARTKSDC